MSRKRMGEAVLWFFLVLGSFYLGVRMGWKAGIDAAEMTGVVPR